MPETERDLYRKALHRCKSKEQADRLHSVQAARFAFDDVFAEFLEEGLYAKLPSEYDLWAGKVCKKKIAAIRRDLCHDVLFGQRTAISENSTA